MIHKIDNLSGHLKFLQAETFSAKKMLEVYPASNSPQAETIWHTVSPFLVGEKE